MIKYRRVYWIYVHEIGDVNAAEIINIVELELSNSSYYVLEMNQINKI